MTMGKNVVVDIYWFPIRFVTYSLVLILLVCDGANGVQGPDVATTGAQTSVIGRCTKQCSSVSTGIYVD